MTHSNPPPPQKNLLVLGASGRVGTLLRAVWDQASPRNTRILYQYRDISDRTDPQSIGFCPGDDPEIFGTLDAVISLWGNISNDAAALLANTTLALEAQRIADCCQAGRVLHASSIAVYAPNPAPLEETDLIAAAAPYGQAKAAMEAALLSHQNPPNCCLRIGSVAGAESLAAALANPSGQPMILDQFENGSGPSRSYIAPSDLADVLAQLCDLDLALLPAALNLGAPKPVTMDQLLLASGAAFSWRPAPETARQIAVLDTTLLCRLVTFAAKASDPNWITADWHRWSSLQ